MRARFMTAMIAITAITLATPISAGARDVDGKNPLWIAYQNQGCAGDEQMSFNPQYPNVGQDVTVTVTSRRPSVNVSLSGPWSPQYLGAQPGGKGTNWYYRFRPGAPGQMNYNFFVGGTVCTANFVNVGGSTPPPAPPSGGFNLQTNAPSPISVSSRQMTISARNAAGAPGQQNYLQIIVAGPLGNGGGPAHSASFTLRGADTLNVVYPGNFPQAAPLQVGRYHIEWTDRGGNDYADTFVDVRP